MRTAQRRALNALEWRNLIDPIYLECRVNVTSPDTARWMPPVDESVFSGYPRIGSIFDSTWVPRGAGGSREDSRTCRAGLSDQDESFPFWAALKGCATATATVAQGFNPASSRPDWIAPDSTQRDEGSVAEHCDRWNKTTRWSDGESQSERRCPLPVVVRWNDRADAEQQRGGVCDSFSELRSSVLKSQVQPFSIGESAMGKRVPLDDGAAADARTFASFRTWIRMPLSGISAERRSCARTYQRQPTLSRRSWLGTRRDPSSVRRSRSMNSAISQIHFSLNQTSYCHVPRAG